MAADKIMACFAGLGRMARLEYQVCIQCAPVLKGIKVSNIVTVKKNSWKTVRNALKGSGVLCVQLYPGKKNDVLILYRPRLMEAHLKQAEVVEFLELHGYELLDTLSVLLQLRRRYRAYDYREASFPHELGVILGYPVKDVEEFISHDGKDYALAGPWKVYQNTAYAQEMFHHYDQARKVAVKQILGGYTLKDVAKTRLFCESVSLS